MTAFVWLFCEMHPPGGGAGSCGKSWRFDVDTVADARQVADDVYPGSPPLYPWVVLECDRPQCQTKLIFQQGNVATVADARDRATRGAGWLTEDQRGQVLDICPRHGEPQPARHRPTPNGPDETQMPLLDLQA
ncbi:hypothetical protein [Microbispora bryophytorum]|uniref:hypothetical protein n=1 Tax=Microbispora bryophytorum TaxID=1460882 RepID=UPI0033E1710D